MSISNDIKTAEETKKLSGWEPSRKLRLRQNNEKCFQLDRGTYRVNRQFTLSELLEFWLHFKKPKLTAETVCPKTYERYCSIVKLQLNPYLGAVPLQKLTPVCIDEMFLSLADCGYSGTTLHHVFSVLRNALNFAVKKLGAISENPVHHLRPPRATTRRPRVSEDAVRAVLEAVKGSRIETLVQVAAMSGLRRGELLALRWESVDFDRKRLVIRESLEESKMYGLRFKTTKSGRDRIIPIPEPLIGFLRAHRQSQVEERACLGDSYCDNDLVFCNPGGTPWPPDTLTKQFAAVVKRCGAPKLRLHDVRHAFASIMLGQGTSIKEVSELLGHSSPVITLSTYAHAMDGIASEAVNRLAASLTRPSSEGLSDKR